MEQFEFVVAEECKFENEAKKSSIFWKFPTINNFMQGTQSHNSPIRTLSAARIFSLPNMIEEFKPVVLLKQEFEHIEKKEKN